ncbi:MAG: hypothetical protein H7210_11550, partial [Pyrinomonadaceae bacterium]|nr:hypothetical protein [Phycisphaerales bacterium]
MTHSKTLAVSIVFAMMLAFTASAQVSLDQAFRDPPAEARPHTWWHWMNGNITREGITADLESMKQIGLGGAQIFNVSESIPLGPIAYNSDEWRGLVKFAATEANRLGLELCIHNCAGWSSSGGPWVTPEFAMQALTISETKAPGSSHFSGVLAQPPVKEKFYRDIVVLAFPTPKDDKTRIADIGAKALREYRYGQQPAMDVFPDVAIVKLASVVDLTAKMNPDGKLEWDAPAAEGGWTILRIGHTPTGAVNAPSPDSGRGLEVDKMSREAFDAYWAGGMAPLIRELGPLAGKTLNNCLVDSYEVGCQNWTPKFREEFKARRGYDPLLYLPVMTGRVIESGETSERFLWDLRRTVGDLFSDNYFSYFAQKCKENGLLSSIEPYDGPFECHQAARDADIVMGEFWANGSMNESCRLAASVGHTYGKKFIGAEAFTAFPEIGKWMNHPGSLKGIGDLMYAAGINRYIIHRYAHQPWKNVNPGMTMGQWGTHFERTTTWWEQGAAWITYLARCQAMLQQGTFVADVLYFAGESSPNGSPYDAELKSNGYNSDACGTDVLLNRTSVKDGRIILKDGMSYRMLVLPDTTFMTLKLAQKVRDLVKGGATVIGPRPTASPTTGGGPGSTREVSTIGAEVWGDCDGKSITQHAFGKGRVLWGMTPLQAMELMSISPDCTFTSPGSAGGKPKTAWIHRTVGKADIYFISNQKPRSQFVECSFRVTGKAPELWHADTGVMEPAPAWFENQGRTIVPIQFDPWGSVFVVFRGESNLAHVETVTPPPVPQGEWHSPKIVISKATYEAIDGAGGVDVTAKVAGAVASGESEIAASNGSFGDPAFNHVKRLRVDYTLDGKATTRAADENSTLVLADTSGPDAALTYRLAVKPGGGGTELHAFRGGRYEFTRSTQKSLRMDVEAVPAPVEVAGAWTVKFQSGRGAPESLTLDALDSLSNSSNPGVKYFSGAADYEKEFNIPAAAMA